MTARRVEEPAPQVPESREKEEVADVQPQRGSDVGTVERAFQLAQSGKCQSLDDIRRELRREQHSSIDAHLAGSSIRKQLLKAMTQPNGAPLAQDATP